MELNNYQKQVMCDLSAYLDCVNRGTNLFSAWREYWFSKDVAVGLGGVPSYNNSIERAPHVCMKVPTGGGKTFMACASVRRIFDALPTGKPQVVVWLVPSDSILTQTIRTLSDVDHPYRQRLDQDFAGRVGVYTKEMLLNGQNFSPDTVREMLTVCVMSYGSLRIDSRKKDVRKVYQENGNLFRFAEYFKDTQALLADTPDTALIQVLRHLEPVVIVDESHNAESKLSTEMLNNLNPSFVLDLTATPRKNSNIISYVDARELKKEHMVKLPVVVYNRTTRQSVIQDAIQLRGSIEQEAIAAEAAGGKYIRPIVLFQAQPRTGDNSDTFDKIKAMLVGMGIPENQIAVKTSDVDDLKGQNLMSRDCEIRYIITVNALKEGWDCPFAYILASLANRTSTVDVEQILGRILRQPYAMQHSSPLLNTSYVLTNSVDFHTTLEKIVVGLNKAGFSRKDYRIGEAIEAPQVPVQPEAEQAEIPFAPQATESDAFDDVNVQEVKTALESTAQGSAAISAILPLQEALGYDLAQSMFFHRKNLVLEGLTDMWYLESLSSLLTEGGKTGINEQIAMIPANCASKVVYFATILKAQHLKIAALLDSDAEGELAAKQDILVNELGNKRILRTKDVYDGPVATPEIEDILRDTLLDIAKDQCGWDVIEMAKAQEKRPIVDILVSEVKRDFSKYKLSKAFVRWAREHTLSDLQKNEIVCAEKLAEKINKALQ